MMEKAINISNAAITTPPLTVSTTVLWDSTADPGTGVTLARRRAWPSICRATVRIYADQVVTLKANDLSKNSTTWRTYNNSGAGDATTASTWFEKNILFVGDDHQITVTAGATPPTVWEVSVKLWTDPALSQ
jgi:hypothetical protein